MARFDEMTEEERKELARKGGINSGKARRKNADLKEITNKILSLTLRKDIPLDIDDIESLEELDGANLSVSERIVLAMVSKAMKGSIMAAEYLRDTSGQRPEDILQLQSEDDKELKIQVNYGKPKENGREGS